MPVLGHAFVGAATALCVPPTRATARDCSSNRRPPRSGEALWIPIVVVLAYVPDIGAQLALLSETERHRAEAIARSIEHVSLAAHPDFQDVFVDCMNFPRS
jgi:hypothetical protein